MANVQAFESDVKTVPGMVAGEDLSSYQYKAVKYSGGLMVKCATLGENGAGILQNAPDASGKTASVAFGGISQVILGGSVSQMERLTTNASAALIAITDPTQALYAVALSDGVAGDAIPAILVLGTNTGNLGTSGKVLQPLLTGLTAADDPVLAEHDHTVAPGTTGALCSAVLPDGTKLGYWVLGAGQTILGPVGAVDSIDISCDQTENEGIEVFSNALCADGRPLRVGFDPAFYFLVKINIANVSGCDDLFIGFKKLELYNADMEAYDTYFGLGFNASAAAAALKVRNELNGGGADNTDTTQTIADGIDLQVKVLVSAAGVATLQHDAAAPGTLAAPTATAALTFDDGDALMPVVRFLHAAAPVAGAILIKDWEVCYQ